MALVDVTNVSGRLVTIRLNSGETLILEPGASAEMVEQEVLGNEKVKKLTGQSVITVRSRVKQVVTEKAEKKTSAARAR